MLVRAEAGHASDDALTIAAGEGSSAEIMVDTTVSIYTDEPGAVQHFLGDRFSAGGRDGPLGTFTVQEVEPPNCANTTLSFSPELPSGFFVAFSEPTQFTPLREAPALRELVVKSVEGAVRSAGGMGEIVPYSIWRFAPVGGTSTLVFAAIRTPNYRDESWGQPGGFDAIALMRQDQGTLALLDAKVWLAYPDSLSMKIDITAVATNPATGHSEMYVRYNSFEYNEYVGYDISGGKLHERLHSGCSM